MVTSLSMAMPRSRTVDDGVTRSAPTLTAADGRLSRLRVVEHQRISVFDVFIFVRDHP